MELVKLDFERPLPELKEGTVVRSFLANFKDPKECFWEVKWETLKEGKYIFVGAKFEGKVHRDILIEEANKCDTPAMFELENHVWN